MGIVEKIGIVLLIITTQALVIDLCQGRDNKIALYFFTTAIGAMMFLLG